MWPKGLRRLQMGPLRVPDDGGNTGGGDGGDDKSKSNKIKVGDTEYDPKDLESATSLYKALQDPETGMEIIKTLAKRAGLLDKEGDIKVKPGETQKEAESRAAKFLRKRLGKDYDKFSDSIGPALDELIQEALEERFGEAEANNTKNSWDKEVDKFNDNYTLTPEIEETMQELMQDSPPNFKAPKFNAQRYLGRMYRAAVEELGIENPTKPKRTTKEDVPDFVVRERPKNASLDDAIEAAMRGIRFKPKE